MVSREHKKRIILLDSHAIIHRAYHALPDFSNSKGEPTGALYGLVSMLIKILTDLAPDYVVACYDVPSPTFRHEAAESYKATRKKIDDDLIAQLIRSKDIFTALNIPIYEAKGFEADDVLATISEQLKADKDAEVIIASGDMDTLQLVSGKKIRAFTLRKGISDTVTYDEDAVIARFGFGPELLPDYKGLRGDPSDNITGVPGIGEKTATELIQKFGSIEDIYTKLKAGKIVSEKGAEGAIKARTIELLKAHEDEARFSKMLATVRRDAPVTFEEPEKNWREAIDMEKVRALFKDLDFKTLLDRVNDLVRGQKTETAQEKKKKTATGSKGATSADSNETGENPAEPAEAKITLPSHITAEQVQKVALALWVVDSNISNPGLADILKYAGTDSFEEAEQKIMSVLKNGRTAEIYNNIEVPLIAVIEKMQKHGVKIDTKHLKKLSTEYHKKLDALQAEIWKLAGEEFNINSPKQMGEVLFGKILLQSKGKTTASGNRSTKESELEKVRDLHPIVPLLLSYRELQKLLSTYIDTIPEKVGGDGRLHAKFVQTGAVTGRLSSQDPNLQNLPIKSELGKRIREAVITEKGFKLATFDYSQIELRIAAILSGDEKLVEIFKHGEDVHTGVASAVFKVPPEKVDSEMRRRAKVINFGILYGMGVNALKGNLGANTTRDEAKLFHEEYFKNFSTLAAYLERTEAEASKLGYTETFFGRRRYFPGLRSKLPYLRAMAERQAINAPIQGTSADLIKISMIEVNKFIEKEKLDEDVFLLLTVHDELVLEIRESLAEKIAPKIKAIMEGVLSTKETGGVPLVVSSAIKDNWGEMK